MFQDDKINNKSASSNGTQPDFSSQNLNAMANDSIFNKVESGSPLAPKAPSNSFNPMNNEFTTGGSSVVDDDLWKNQPTSKIFNAANIAAQQIFGINRVVKLRLVIEGQSIPHFKHFKLVQSAKKHHEFSVELAYDVMGSAENYRLESAQDFLGKRLTAIFNYKDVEESPERVFVGVITEVGFSQDQGSLGNILLKGFSPTILLDAAPHTQSFGGDQPISLSSIADNVIKQGLDKSKYDYRIAAEYGNITYSSQYEETHYNYLARMAEAYGEQFFYDGEVLHFGAMPPQEKPLELKYGSNVHDIKIFMKAQHINPSFYGYNSSKDEKLTTGESTINHKSDIANRAYGISQKTFKTPSLRVAPIKSSTSMDITASQKGTAGSKAVDVFVTSGTTSVPFLYPGCPANIEMRQQDSNKTSYFTKLLITDVVHEVDARGYYNGYFEAIAADTGFMPKPEFEFPKAQPQVAKVISNTDPLNQGRVQVQFDWQMGGDKSEFIRVMTPDAGGSDKVSTNRGFMAIPEVGDQVMIGFQHNHPDRPFVFGGMFHGKVGAGGGSGNNVKSLSSRSGNKLELNDGEGSVYLTDQGGANMKFDGAGNVIYNANNDSTKTIGNNKTDKVGNDKQLKVGNNHTCEVGTKHKTDVGKGNSCLTMDKDGVIDLSGAKKITIKVSDSKIEITPSSINLISKTIKINGISEVDVNGAGATANFNGNTSITGGKIIEN